MEDINKDFKYAKGIYPKQIIIQLNNKIVLGTQSCPTSLQLNRLQAILKFYSQMVDVNRHQTFVMLFQQPKLYLAQGKCKLLECNKLKLPTYKNHEKGQEACSNCTFNQDNFGCKDYFCENIQEIEFCQIDSKKTVCQINQGCIDKNALLLYQIMRAIHIVKSGCHCAQVQELSNSKLSIGCIDKKSKCEIAQEEQCYSTFSGMKCKWGKVGKNVHLSILHKS
ncbi:unnamed protein product [Paramecium octaurelia]|uniref:Uncharacterized protein n=1 Tax=Paramecium octaurelia TaxID=43137 RepID=A0A8S1W5L9_PAROT|nr:unnamed protein product [Paramecium octaurelia]